MEWFQDLKTAIVNYKLDFCCWLLPMRIGCVVTACFNIITDFICIVGIANEGFSPTITKVQEALIEDYVTKPPTLLAYTMELSMNVIFLCGIYRKDNKLLRVFMYYSIIALVMSFLIYSIIIAALPKEIAVLLVIFPLFQAYTILLVRSYMVEIKLENRKYVLPTILTMSSLQDKDSASVVKTDKIDNPPNRSQEIKVIIPEKVTEDEKDIKICIKQTPDVKTNVELKKQIEDQAKDGNKKEDKAIFKKIIDIKKDKKGKQEKIVTKVKEEEKNDIIGKTETKSVEKDIETKDDKIAINKTTTETKIDNTLKVENKPDIEETKKDKVKEEKQENKGKEETQEPKLKKPREIKSVQSIFSRRKKQLKNTNVEKDNAETNKDKDVKLATVNEHPKE